MSAWIKTIVVLVIIILFIVMSFCALIRYHENNTEKMLSRLNSQCNSHKVLYVDFKNIKALPEPVRRYFKNILQEGQPFIKKTYIVQSGELTTGPKTKEWSSFQAEEYVSSVKPGFIWKARVAIASLLHLKILDTYMDGKACGSVLLFSALKVASEKENKKLNSGALFRYLAEAVWYPTSLLPENGVTWTPIDQENALATLTDGGISVSLKFTFNDKGEIINVYTDKRYGLFEGEYRQYPWEGSFSNYIEKNGMRIPQRGQVGWHLPEGFWLFWKGKIEEIEYTFMQ